MKIAVSTKGNMSTRTVAPFSDRHGEFVIYDSDNFQFTYLDAPADQTSSRRNVIQSTKMMVEAGIDVLIVDGITRQSAHMLGRCGIRIYQCISATVLEAIQGLKLNILKAIDADTGFTATCTMVDD